MVSFARFKLTHPSICDSSWLKILAYLDRIFGSPSVSASSISFSLDGSNVIAIFFQKYFRSSEPQLEYVVSHDFPFPGKTKFAGFTLRRASWNLQSIDIRS